MEGKVEEENGERQKVERLVEKLKNYTTKSNNGPSTPVHVSFSSSKFYSPSSDVVSSRKLAAAFWEFHHYYYREDHRSFFSPPAAAAAAKMHRRQQRHGKAVVKENGLDLSQFLRDPSPDHQPESAGSLRRQIGQVLMKHHQSLERNNHALQPVSPASYGSSLEVAPYNKAVTPSSSLEFRGRPFQEPHYNLKTSTELLKVLNRIWTLEEQHASNLSLIKSLKTELAHSRLRIKELLRYQQADRHELNGVVKQLAEENLSRKNKEVERIQSARKELEDERKLRKRSESMQRKLARELSEVKLSLSECVKEVERGNKSKKMVEMLCDEFAKGIKRYEEEFHGLKHKDQVEERDQMVLHVAESWLDERMQMRLEGGGDRSVLDKLGAEIETFLHAKRRSSLESVPFNALSAPPRDVECEQDSGASDSNCFELKKPVEESHVNQTNQDDVKPFQVKFEDQMAWAMSSSGKKKTQTIKEEEDDAEPEKNSGNKQENETTNKNDVMGEMIRTHRRLLSETGEASCSSYPSSWRQASPVRQWTSRTVAAELLGSSETSAATGIGQGVKDNTLKTKLAKSSKSRLRLFKG
ncbi:Uncharacterized protein HA466_0068090 [Hirschfeldia incana]|nr:Uncharacterized protein HA466_0068090 [Hirschfeldia incana]